MYLCTVPQSFIPRNAQHFYSQMRVLLKRSLCRRLRHNHHSKRWTTFFPDVGRQFIIIVLIKYRERHVTVSVVRVWWRHKASSFGPMGSCEDSSGAKKKFASFLFSPVVAEGGRDKRTLYERVQEQRMIEQELWEESHSFSTECVYVLMSRELDLQRAG